MTAQDALQAAVERFVAEDPDQATRFTGDWTLIVELTPLDPADETRYAIAVSGDHLPQHRLRGLLDIGHDLADQEDA